jgi:L-asparaginase II
MEHALPILAEVTRGPITEARHRGAITVVAPDGHTIAGLGNDGFITSTRSTIKPIQAIPFITSGAADSFNVSERELAVVCASHEGEKIHTEAVADLLARAGLDESALRCGPQLPYNQETAKELESSGEPFTQLHNNCSGKHAGMLMTAVVRGLSLDDYISIEHPVQREIVSTFASLAGLNQNLPTAIDGCSAPTFGVPLRSLAVAFARLVNPSELDPKTAGAARRIVDAMFKHPEMVGGTKGRFDTELLRAARGKLICKVGAEASYCVGVLPSAKFPRGIGIAVKMEDGSYRGLGPTVVEILHQLAILDDDEVSQLAAYHKPVIENRRGLNVGQVRSVFKL